MDGCAPLQSAKLTSGPIEMAGSLRSTASKGGAYSALLLQSTPCGSQGAHQSPETRLFVVQWLYNEAQLLRSIQVDSQQLWPMELHAQGCK